jgi:Flp pilus assembly protein TadD
VSWRSLWSRSKEEVILPEEAYAKGMEAWKSGALDVAQDFLQRAAEARPTELKYVGNLGNLYHEREDWVSALRCHRAAAEIAPDHAGAHRNQGKAFLQMGRFHEATRAYERSLELEPTDAQSAVLCAHALASSGDLVGAWVRCEVSIDKGAASPDLHTLLLELLIECNEIDKAGIASRLPEIAPAVLHKLALGYLRLNRSLDASEVLTRAVQQSPNDHTLVFHLAIAQKNAGQRHEAQVSFARAAEIKPADPLSRANLGWLQLQNGLLTDALHSMQEAARIGTLQPPPDDELRAVPSHRIHHDAEQFRYLMKTSSLSDEARAYAHEIIALDEALPSTPGVIDLTLPDHAKIRAGWNRHHHLPDCPAHPDSALNPALDLHQIQTAYQASSPEMVIVDDLLRPDALKALQRYCREATIWKRTYESGYVGAFMRSGLATALILQLAEELREALPQIIGDHRLEQCWSFKCDGGLDAVSLHADVAAVNVNLWISTEDGNEDPDSGGLRVWDVESPSDWAFSDYNANQPKAREFLRASNAQPIAVAHRSNRALIFNSTLFHESDRIQFRPDYENRRINITLLYGIRLLES